MFTFVIQYIPSHQSFLSFPLSLYPPFSPSYSFISSHFSVHIVDDDNKEVVIVHYHYFPSSRPSFLLSSDSCFTFILLLFDMGGRTEGKEGSFPSICPWLSVCVTAQQN